MLYFVAGTGLAKIGEVETEVADGDVSIVPSGTFHNFRNTGSGMLKLFTTYSPPEHEPGTEHATKADAEADLPGGGPYGPSDGRSMPIC